VPERVVIDLVTGDDGHVGDVTVGMWTDQMPDHRRNRHDHQTGARPQQDEPADGDLE
jgi:hypothetical protein